MIIEAKKMNGIGFSASTIRGAPDEPTIAAVSEIVKTAPD